MKAWQTLAANLASAARNNMTTRIGGGEFRPAEIREALAEITAQIDSYRAQRDAEGARAVRAEKTLERLRK
jgi:hypothetical protein